MTGEPSSIEELLETVDACNLQTLSWGPLRAMFPRFAERVELDRHVSALLAAGRCHAVRIQQHRQEDGQLSVHIFDVYRLS
jgi:hypothetical protein